ncbi:hypothetical protein OROMI_024357 [Orobanche minor]
MFNIHLDHTQYVLFVISIVQFGILNIIKTLELPPESVYPICIAACANMCTRNIVVN